MTRVNSTLLYLSFSTPGDGEVSTGSQSFPLARSTRQDFGVRLVYVVECKGEFFRPLRIFLHKFVIGFALFAQYLPPIPAA